MLKSVLSALHLFGGHKVSLPSTDQKRFSRFTIGPKRDGRGVPILTSDSDSSFDSESDIVLEKLDRPAKRVERVTRAATAATVTSLPLFVHSSDDSNVIDLNLSPPPSPSPLSSSKRAHETQYTVLDQKFSDAYRAKYQFVFDALKKRADAMAGVTIADDTVTEDADTGSDSISTTTTATSDAARCRTAPKSIPSVPEFNREGVVMTGVEPDYQIVHYYENLDVHNIVLDGDKNTYRLVYAQLASFLKTHNDHLTDIQILELECQPTDGSINDVLRILKRFPALKSLHLIYPNGTLRDHAFFYAPNLQYLCIEGAYSPLTDRRVFAGLKSLRVLHFISGKRLAEQPIRGTSAKVLPCLQTRLPTLKKLVIEVWDGGIVRSLTSHVILPSNMAKYMPRLRYLEAKNGVLAYQGGDTNRVFMNNDDLKAVIPPSVVHIRCNLACNLTYDAFRDYTDLRSLNLSLCNDAENSTFMIDCNRFTPKLMTLICCDVAPRIHQLSQLRILHLNQVNCADLVCVPATVTELSMAHCLYVTDEMLHPAAGVEHLRLESIRYDTLDRPQWFVDPLRNMTRMQTLSLVNISFTMAVNPFRTLKSLETLHWVGDMKLVYPLYPQHMTVDQKQASGILDGAQATLKSAVLQDITSVQCLAGTDAVFPVLSSLSCTRMPFLTDIIHGTHPSTLPVAFPALETLELESIPDLRWIPCDQMPHLDTLKCRRTIITRCTPRIRMQSVSPEAEAQRVRANMFQMFKPLTLLIHLDCSGNDWIQNDALHALPSLRALNCKHCTQLTDGAFDRLAFLQTLECGQCHNLTRNPFGMLLHLSHLDVEKCEQLHPHAIDVVVDRLNSIYVLPSHYISKNDIAHWNQIVTANTRKNFSSNYNTLESELDQARGDADIEIEEMRQQRIFDDAMRDAEWPLHLQSVDWHQTMIDQPENIFLPRNIIMPEDRVAASSVVQPHWDLLPPSPRQVKAPFYVYSTLNGAIMRQFLAKRYNSKIGGAGNLGERVVCVDMPGMYGDANDIKWIAPDFDQAALGSYISDLRCVPSPTAAQTEILQHAYKDTAYSRALSYIDACQNYAYAIIPFVISAAAIHTALQQAGRPVSSEDDASHATLIFVDQPNRTFEFWDPNGPNISSTAHYHMTLSTELRSIFKGTPWEQFEVKVGNLGQRGIQAQHALFPYIAQYTTSAHGICLIAAMIMADIRIYHAQRNGLFLSYEATEQRIHNEMKTHVDEWHAYLNGVIATINTHFERAFKNILFDASTNDITPANLTLRELVPDLVDFAWLYMHGPPLSNDMRRAVIDYVSDGYARLFTQYVRYSREEMHQRILDGEIDASTYIQLRRPYRDRMFPITLYETLLPAMKGRYQPIDVVKWYEEQDAPGRHNVCMTVRMAYEQFTRVPGQPTPVSWAVTIDKPQRKFPLMVLRQVLCQKQVFAMMETLKIRSKRVYTIQCQQTDAYTELDLFDIDGGHVFMMRYTYATDTTELEWPMQQNTRQTCVHFNSTGSADTYNFVASYGLQDEHTRHDSEMMRPSRARPIPDETAGTGAETDTVVPVSHPYIENRQVPVCMAVMRDVLRESVTDAAETTVYRQTKVRSNLGI